MNSLFYALRPLASDFLPTIAFAILVALHASVPVATAGALGVALAQLAVQRLVFKRPIPLLQWASIGLVVFFGGLGLLTHDARYLMIKPTLVYLAVGAVMLKRGWMLRYLPPIASGHGDQLMVRWGYGWAGLMFASGAANLAVAWLAPALWPAYLATVPMASKLLMFAVQYVSIRYVVRRKMLAERAGGAGQPQPLAA